MGRSIQSRLKVSGTLVTTGPLHVGGRGGHMLLDLPLALNGADQFYIPGSSLAGVLRQWMGDSNELWGFQSEDNGHASAIFVEDALIQGVISELRDGVAIDRDSGTAAEHFKFQRAILPKGTQIPIELTLEQTQDNADWETSKAKLAGLLQALKGQQIYLGAAKTRGLGGVKLTELNISEQNFSTRRGIIEVLRGSGTAVSLSALSAIPYASPHPDIKMTIDWQPVGPVMVKAEAEGIAVDGLPLVSGNGNDLTYVLPGSAIKGALRTQAERIIRTVKGLDLTRELDQKKRLRRQIETVPLISDIFGYANQTNIGDPATGASKTNGKIGALAIADCYAQLSFSSNQWHTVTTAKDETHLRQALDAAHLEQTQQAFHVAIDRWTGGAADGFLYSTLEPLGVTWEPIQLRLATSRLKDHNPAMALLLLLLRDLVRGKIPLGFAANRGMGAIKVTKITLTTPRNNEFNIPNFTVESPTPDFLDSVTGLEPMITAWQDWIQEVPNDNSLMA
jgi:CRISPR/Cas system CSM-associated protein Csm3 (group 7 of RAMP superfamily)